MRHQLGRRVLLATLAAAGCAACPLHLGVFVLGYFGVRSAAWSVPTWAEALVVLVAFGWLEVWWHRRHRVTCRHHEPGVPIAETCGEVHP